MARAPNENIKKAYELYKQDVKLVEIASQLNVPAGTVRRWKSTYKWDNERSDKNNERSVKHNKDISWVEIENEYVTDIRKKPCSLDDLAAKYNTPLKTIKDKCKKGEWVKKRTEYVLQTSQKAIEKSSEKDADRIMRLLEIADIATLKAEQSLNELETYIVKNKKKVREIEYNDSSAPGKPTKEVIHEDESIDTVPGPIDRQGLMLVTSSLKNIKELYSITNDIKLQEHRIDIDKKKLELEQQRLTSEEKDTVINLIHSIPRPNYEGSDEE